MHVSSPATAPTRAAVRDRPFVAVIVVTYNSAALLADFCAALPAALEGLRWRLVVADNDSADQSLAVAAALEPAADVRQLGRNAGYAAGVNAGVAAVTDADAYLVLNPDVRLRPGSVVRLWEALSTPGCGLAVPRLVDGDGRRLDSLRRRPTVLRALGEALLGGSTAGHIPALGEVVRDPRRYAHPCTADWATGAAMLVSRACLDAVGAWDERFFLYGEETDFALRASDEGHVLRYVPDAEAVHLGGEVLRDPALWSLLARNRVRLHHKRHGPVRAGLLWAVVVLNEALRAARGSPTNRAALRALLTPRRPATTHGAPHLAADDPGYLCFSAQDWWYHNRAHSDFQLMRNVARTRTVLFVNTIGMRMPAPGRTAQPFRRILRKARSVGKGLRRPVPELDRFWVFTPLMLPFYGSPRARQLNTGLVRAQVRWCARRLGLDRPVCVVTIPTAWDVVEGLDCRRVLYNRSDRHSAFPEADTAFIEALEQRMLAGADHVLYCSHELMEAEAGVAGERAYFLDHGVDFAHFQRRPVSAQPADLRRIPRPRIGFFGGLDDYIIDFGLLERVARDLPDAHLVLVGDATCSMERLTRLPNVHWLGYRDYDTIPSYGSGFDVALMPWLDNDWIRHANPIKLKEYLALGLPVVSTEFPEGRRYGQWLRLASDADAFVAAVRDCLSAEDHRPAARRAAVDDASWEGRAAELIALAEHDGRPRSAAL